MKGMSNNQIIMNEAAKLAPATLHAIATAHHTAAQIEALAAQITVTEDDGTQHPGATHDAEIVLAAGELHTFDYWKKAGQSVRLHEKALIECYLWKYTTKPSKAQREAAEAEGKEAAPDPHYYPTKSHLFSCLQVQDSKPAPAGRFSSTAEIIAYNKKLAAERKAAKEAAEQAASAPAPIITEERHELPDSAFGIPETREFPLVDAEHVRAAEAYFRYAPDNKKAALARRILAKAAAYGVNVQSQVIRSWAEE